MHLATLVTLAATASTLATARLDRTSHSNRGRSHPSTLGKRAPGPEPFRYFATDGGSTFDSHDGVVALRERGAGGDEAAHLARADLARRARTAAKLGRRAADESVHHTTAIYLSETGWQSVCGETITDDALVVLLPLSLYPDAGVASSLCGQAVTVSAKSTGKTVTATVYGGSDRDEYTTFSQAAYLALGGDLDAGVLDVEFSLGAAAAAAAAPPTEAKGETASKPVAAPVVAAAKVETSEPKVESKVEHKTEKKTSHKDKAAKIAAKKVAEKQAAADKKAADAAAAAAQAQASAEDKKAAADKQAAADKAAADKIWADREAAKAAEAEKQKKADEEAKWAADEAAKKAEEQKKADEQKKEQAKKVADTSSGNKLAAVPVADTSSKGKSLIGYHASNCGPSGATDDEPNGSQSWLNCGISKSNPGSGWTPPAGVTLDRITTVSFEHALATNSVWEPCRKWTDLFDTVAAETGLPAILLASFALQESTCNPSVVGGGGEAGMFQITHDKCGGRSTSDCAEPWYNARTAAKYFKGELDNSGGQFLKALGAYNGWYEGLSYNGATAAQWSGCCLCQQNLDYLEQMLSGWLLGRTGYERGSYHNLKVCGHQD
ncbi:hypothetical protein JCM9279_006067 [Rhodotorula babjevae]